MPSVDINSPSQSGVGGGKQGFGTGLPTPVLLAVVGGGLGLVVFLSKKSSASQDSSKGTLLPNTAIMLGSLQQGVLDLQGKVTSGNADLSSQLTGVGENLGTQIDMQSAGINQSFADLNTYLGGNFQNLTASEGALSTAIAGLGTQNADLATSLTTILQNLYGVNTGLTNLSGQLTNVGQGINAGLGGISQQIQTNQGSLAAISGGINGVLNNQSYQNTLLNGLGQSTTQTVSALLPGSFVNTQHSGIGVVLADGRIHGFSSMQEFTAWPGGKAVAMGNTNNMAYMNDAVFQSLLER